MELTGKLAQERRGRLAAERLLEQRTRELFAANERLDLHARLLVEQVVEQREEVRSALDEAAQIKGQHSFTLDRLERAHAAAIVAERRLWNSLDTVRDGFAVFDSSLTLVMANRAYQNVFTDFSLHPGINYAELFETLATGDQINLGDETASDWVRRMMERLDSDRIKPETLHLTDGRWIELSDRRTHEDDVVSVIIDKTGEMRIWAAIEALPDAFVLFDRDERLLAFNRQYVELFPDSADHMIRGVTFEHLLRDSLGKGAVRDALGREEEWLAGRLHQMRAAAASCESQLSDGRWIREREYPTPDGGRVGLRSDITWAREQQAALEEARRAAEAASRAKSAFLANMSHEIRTPMNGVVGMAELLCDTSLNEEQRLFAETIRSSGEALLVIINDILDYSKIEAGRLAFYPEPFDLERLLHEVVILLQPRARAKGLEMLIDYDVLLPTRFVCDPGRLRQVLTNLIGNAVKFTETGRVLTRVSGRLLAGNQYSLTITVEDTGPGIDPSLQKRIFTEFDQGETAQNRRFEGTGLGLAISKRLVEHMGGEIWLHSVPDEGSTFGFRISLGRAEGANIIAPPAEIRQALVVNDRLINRTILERQLGACGIQTTLCRTAAEALGCLAQGRHCDVVITEHELPGMDGIAMAAKLREQGFAGPVLLLSSDPSAASENGLASGIDAILPKPVLRSDLYRRLREIATGRVAKQPTQPAPAPPEIRARPMRILAAEDNRTNRLVLQKMLKGLNIELFLATNGREAVDLWQSQQPDLIFMDISMPEMDGKEASRLIRASETDGAHVPIIALTAHAMEGDADDILAAGIDACLTKPLRKAALIEALTIHHPPGVDPGLPVPAPEIPAAG